jgi:hypothetical protein
MQEHTATVAAAAKTADAGPADTAQRAWLELRLAEMRQIFNAMDPAPFQERDLDPKLAFFAVVIAVGEYLSHVINKESYGYIAKESLVIAGRVALWRPLEILLYDWWPIRAEARLLDRLGEMRVRAITSAVAAA